MSDKIMEIGSSVGEIVAMPGLNLVITPDRPHEPCSVLNLSLVVADAAGFLGRKSEHGRVLVFSLGDAKKMMEQRLAQYNAVLGDLTVVYAYQKGTFGNKIENGLDVFLQNNPNVKMVVIDSLEKIVEAEFGRIEYAYAYRKLCKIKDVADRHRVSLMVGVHDEDSENISMLIDTADTELKVITESENQNNHKYTLHVNRKDMHGKEITVEFDVNDCTWRQIVTK